MEEKDENGKIILNLDNPIFALYVNVEGLGRQRAVEMINRAKHDFDVYNATMLVLPSNETKIECVYSEGSDVGGKNTKKVLEELNKMCELLSNCDTQEEFRYGLREIRLNDLDDLTSCV